MHGNICLTCRQSHIQHLDEQFSMLDTCIMEIEQWLYATVLLYFALVECWWCDEVNATKETAKHEKEIQTKSFEINKRKKNFVPSNKMKKICDSFCLSIFLFRIFLPREMNGTLFHSTFFGRLVARCCSVRRFIFFVPVHRLQLTTKNNWLFSSFYFFLA